MRAKPIHAVLAAALVIGARPAVGCELDITIQPAKGGATLYGQVFADAATFPKVNGGIVAFTLAPNSTTAVAIKALPAGRYAVAAFEDTKGTGKLDKNFLGVPTEPYGFSNDATGTFGPPSFDQAAVDCRGDPVVVTIHLH